MTPEQLKLSILQYAMQGKLVEQQIEEGTAEELYEQIQKVKDKLIKEGKIKKQKILAEITDEEKLFDIPDTWKWCRLSQIIDVRDGTHDSPKYVPQGIPLITSKNLKNGIIDYTNIKYISVIDANKINERSAVDNGDILFAMIGSIGNPVLVQKDRKFCIKNMALFKKYQHTNMYMPYMYWFFCFIQYSLKAEASGGVQSFISLKKFRKLLVPLPPYSEQKRIANKIDELLHIVDKYLVSWSKIHQLNVEFPKKMKDSILQYAIQGKLVEQRPEEGSAEELYGCIIEDRNKKIKEGIIKKDKRTFLDEIKETPFDIPDNWKWVTLGSILLKLTDGTHKTPKYVNHGVKFVSVKDMSSGKLSLEHTKFITEEEHKELFKRCNPQKGDILLSKVGTTGVPAIIDTDEQFSLFVSVALLKYNHKFINEKYLYYLLLSPLVQQQAAENTRGVGNKNWVLDAIGKTMIALPPYQEQIRIVSELEKILPYCEQLI